VILTWTSSEITMIRELRQGLSKTVGKSLTEVWAESCRYQNDSHFQNLFWIRKGQINQVANTKEEDESRRLITDVVSIANIRMIANCVQQWRKLFSIIRHFSINRGGTEESPNKPQSRWSISSRIWSRSHYFITNFFVLIGGYLTSMLQSWNCFAGESKTTRQWMLQLDW
jgi:hypothetical protein